MMVDIARRLLRDAIKDVLEGHRHDGRLGSGWLAEEILEYVQTSPWYAAEIEAAERRGAVKAWSEGFDTASDDLGLDDMMVGHGESLNPYRSDHA